MYSVLYVYMSLFISYTHESEYNVMGLHLPSSAYPERTTYIYVSFVLYVVTETNIHVVYTTTHPDTTTDLNNNIHIVVQSHMITMYVHVLHDIY